MSNDTTKRNDTEQPSEQARLRRQRDNRLYKYNVKDKGAMLSRWGITILCIVAAVILFLCFVTRMLII